ncbi:MAG: zinc-binding alcohol dehydrogenase [Caldilineaceae bacterium]
MSEVKTVRSLGVEDVGHAYIFSYEEGALPDNHFRVDTLYSGISSGTELTFYRGTNPYLHARWDEEFGLFRTGESSAHYPMPFLGYMEVGRVTESRAQGVHEGDVVAMAYGHKTGHTTDTVHEFYMPFPHDVNPILGIYVAQMGPICANGLLHAAAEAVGQNVRNLGEGVYGRNVLIIGAGVVGQLTALFARHWGAANVVVANRTQPRLDAARAMGLTAINEDETDLCRYCKEQWHHGANDRGVDVVFQCRAEPASLQMALRCLRPQGTVIDMAFYQEGAEKLRLGEEFHHNGLTIRCAQIGRVPRGLGHLWNRQRLAYETINLLRTYGAAIRENLITDIVPFAEGPAFMAQMAAQYQPHVIQAVLKMEQDDDDATTATAQVERFLANAQAVQPVKIPAMREAVHA